MVPTRITTRSAGNADYEFTRLKLEDLDDLTSLEKICFSHPWTRKQFCLGLKHGRFYVFGFRKAGRPIAYLAFSRKTDTMEILKLAVDPDYRRSGLGKRLLGLVLKIGSEMGIKQVRLELRRSNSTAFKLYTHFNFTPSGVKRKYYPDTGEDALILFLDLNAMRGNR